MKVPFPFLLLLASLISAAFATAALSDAPVGELKQSLNGTWEFTVDPAVANGQGAWDSLEVPGNWDVQDRYSTHRGNGWYRREFQAPSDWKGRHVRLRFEAVYHDAEVSLNGEKLGGHVGGYTPFEFDVTDKLNYGGKNTVLVRADNNYRRGAWWPWGGISRDVSLIANNDARIVWQHIRTEPDLASGRAQVFVRYKIVNDGKTLLNASLTSRIGETSAAPLETKATVAPGSEAIVEAKVSLPKQDVRLWHFDQPNLYIFSTTLASGGKPLHSKRNRFGIRKIEVTKEGLFLNGEQIRVPGFNRVSDSPTTGNTEPDELIRKDVDMMKTAGAVMARLMHTPQAPSLLDYLDEKGMMIFAEIPVWGSGDPQVKKDNPLTKQWLREMIERDYNHPCIIGWSPGNEITGHYEYVASMREFVTKELDPYRLFAYISFTAYRGDHGPKNDPVTVSDIAMVNKYGNPGAFANLSGILRQRWPDKPVFLSEFGDHQIGASLKAKIPKLENIWANINKDTYVIGGALWTFNDYRSGFQGTPASGNREWGVVTVDRQPKAAYWQIRKVYSPVRSLSVDNGAVSVVPRSRAESPSYTLRGYSIAWSLANASGKTISQGTIPVPTLAPDAPLWSTDIPGARQAAKISVSLVTPTGYRVDDAASDPAAAR